MTSLYLNARISRLLNAPSETCGRRQRSYIHVRHVAQIVSTQQTEAAQVTFMSSAFGPHHNVLCAVLLGCYWFSLLFGSGVTSHKETSLCLMREITGSSLFPNYQKWHHTKKTKLFSLAFVRRCSVTNLSYFRNVKSKNLSMSLCSCFSFFLAWCRLLWDSETLLSQRILRPLCYSTLFCSVCRSETRVSVSRCGAAVFPVSPKWMLMFIEDPFGSIRKVIIKTSNITQQYVEVW